MINANSLTKNDNQQKFKKQVNFWTYENYMIWEFLTPINFDFDNEVFFSKFNNVLYETVGIKNIKIKRIKLKKIDADVEHLKMIYAIMQFKKIGEVLDLEKDEVISLEKHFVELM